MQVILEYSVVIDLLSHGEAGLRVKEYGLPVAVTNRR